MANYLHKTRDPVDWRPSTSTAKIATQDGSYSAADWFINPDVSAVYDSSTRSYLVPRKYWSRPLTDPVTEMSSAEKSAVDAAEAQAIIDEAKAAAKQLHSELDYQGRAIRAIVLLVVDELNVLRTQWRDFQAEVAATTNLNDFQSRIAGLPSLGDRTYSQAKTAIDNEIDAE